MCKNLTFGWSIKVIVVAMAQMENLCKIFLISAIFVFLDFTLESNHIHALSVDYTKAHQCSHEHPKADEVS